MTDFLAFLATLTKPELDDLRCVCAPEHWQIVSDEISRRNDEEFRAHRKRKEQTMDMARLMEIIRELQAVTIPDKEAQSNLDAAIAYLGCMAESVRKAVERAEKATPAPRADWRGGQANLR